MVTRIRSRERSRKRSRARSRTVGLGAHQSKINNLIDAESSPRRRPASAASVDARRTAGPTKTPPIGGAGSAGYSYVGFLHGRRPPDDDPRTEGGVGNAG